MKKIIIIIVLIFLIGCKNSSDATTNRLVFIEKDIYGSDANLYSISLSPDNKALFIRGENGVTMLNSETRSKITDVSFNEVENILWHTHRNLLSNGVRGYEHIDLNTKKIRQLEDGLKPTAWSPDGKTLYAYQDNRIYEIDVKNLEKREIVLDELYLNHEKKVLFTTVAGFKIILLSQDKLLILDKVNRIKDQIEGIDYIEGIMENTIKLTENGKLISFYKKPKIEDSEKRSGSELWIYHLETMKSTKVTEVKGFNILWKHTNDEILVYDYLESLQLINLGTKEAKQLLYSKNEKIVDVAWVDGTNNAAVVVRQFASIFAKDVYRLIDTESGEVLIEKDLGGVAQDVVWFSDGKSLYYILDEKSGGKVLKLQIIKQ
jgi:tricorn protease-like protein